MMTEAWLVYHLPVVLHLRRAAVWCRQRVVYRPRLQETTIALFIAGIIPLLMIILTLTFQVVPLDGYIGLMELPER